MPPSSPDPGEIIDGSNSILNPDGGTFMSNLSGDVTWTVTDNEFSQFETVTAIGGANVPWRILENAGTEPNGVEDPNDTQSGGSCGNTDIVTDSDGGFDYAYYAIIDPDGTADNGDEILALALRISDEVSGAFSFSFLLDAGNDIGSDANEVCGNPGFEYEIQIESNGNKVNLINIDGCAGESDCDAPNGGDAEICAPCNSGALQVAASSSACSGGSLQPVFWMAHIPFSSLTGVDATDDFRLAVATTTSPNSVIYKGTNVADYGGIGDPDAVSECDCAAECSGSGCSDCEQDCAFTCATVQPSPFPVEWLAFEGEYMNQQVVLKWVTGNEVNNNYFEIERLSVADQFEKIGQVEGIGNSEEPRTYSFVSDAAGEEKSFYRLRQVDFDGQSSYSNIIEVSLKDEGLTVESFFNGIEDRIEVKVVNPTPTSIGIRILGIDGKEVLGSVQDHAGGSSTFNLPASQLSSGTYFIQVGDQQTRQLVTKQISVVR